MASACRLLALVLAATAVLTVPSGNNHKLADAARTSRAEAFWRAALPGAPMPEAIRELLHPHTADKSTVLINDDVKLTKDERSDPPPMNFNYDDYKSASRRNANPAPSAEVLQMKHAAAGAPENAADGNVAASLPTLIFLEEDAVRVPRAAGLDPPRLLYAVRAPALESGGSSFVVCRREAGDGAVTTTTYVCRAREYAAAGGRGDDARVLAAGNDDDDERPVSP